MVELTDTQAPTINVLHGATRSDILIVDTYCWYRESIKLTDNNQVLDM